MATKPHTVRLSAAELHLVKTIRALIEMRVAPPDAVEILTRSIADEYKKPTKSNWFSGGI